MPMEIKLFKKKKNTRNRCKGTSASGGRNL